MTKVQQTRVVATLPNVILNYVRQRVSDCKNFRLQMIFRRVTL